MARSWTKARAGVVALEIAASGVVEASAQTDRPRVEVIRGAAAYVVVVDVVVVDRAGRPVANLTAAEFVLREDGRPQSITHFEAIALDDRPTVPAPLPRVSTSAEAAGAVEGAGLAIVFDERHLSPESVGAARKAVDALLGRGLRPGDEIVLVGTGRGEVWRAHDDATLARMRSKVEELRGLRVASPEEDVVTDYEAMRIVTRQDPIALQAGRTRLLEKERADGGLITSSGRGVAQNRIDSSAGTVRRMADRVYTEAAARARNTLTVLEGLTRALGGRPGRKSVVLVTEGFIADATQPDWRRSLEAARRANVVVYGLDVRGLRASATWGADTQHRPVVIEGDESTFAGREASEGSEALATETGGFTRRYTNDLGDALDRIAVESRNYYLLGFEPEGPLDGSYRRLTVELRRPGLTVRARRGYYATPAPEALPAVPPPMPLRLASYVREPGAGGTVRVRLVGEIDPGAIAFHAEGGVSVAVVDGVIEVEGPAGETQRQPLHLKLALAPEALASAQETWLPVSAELDLPPGAHRARLTVREEGEPRAGRVEHPFEVPSPGPPYLATPILSDRLRSPGVRAPAFLARRSFATGSRVLCEVELHNPTLTSSGESRVSASHEVRDAAGLVLTQSAATPLLPSADGRWARLIWMSLERTPPGRYALVLRVRDEVSGTTLETVEPFEVVAHQ